METCKEPTYEELKKRQAELYKVYADDYRELDVIDAAIKKAQSYEEYEELGLKHALKTMEMCHEGKMVSYAAEDVFAEFRKRYCCGDTQC